MNKKILLSFVVLLFLFSLYKTCDLLDINFVNNSSSESKGQEKITKEMEISSVNNKNTFQTGEGILFDDEYIFYNSDKSLIRQDINTKEKIPILTNMNLKNIIDADENIIGTTTIANSNDILMDYVMMVSKDGVDQTIFYKTECSFITSKCFDGTTIYYTNESHNIYSLNPETKEQTIFVKSSEKSDYPFLLGIYNNNLYYVDGTSISYVNLSDKKITVLSTEGCSTIQKPVLINNKIYYFSSLKTDSISVLDIDTNKVTTIIDSEYLSKKTNSKRIDNFNIIDNYLFLNIQGNIYYCFLDDTKGLVFYKEIPSTELNVTNDSIFYINENKIEYIYVNWLISK